MYPEILVPFTVYSLVGCIAAKGLGIGSPRILVQEVIA